MPRSSFPGWILLGAVLAIAPRVYPGYPGYGGHPARTKPTPCPGGTFEVTSGPIFTSSASPALVAVSSGGVTLSGCGAATRSKVRAASKKTTTVTASWPSCGTFTKVRLTAKIAAPACTTLTGKLRGKKKQKSNVVAQLRTPTTTTTTQPGGTTTSSSGGTTTTGAGTTTTTTSGGTTTTGGGSTTTLPGCAANYASCSSFTDLTAPGADRTISFPVGGFAYSPKCIRIKAGQTVTFAGPFSFHPLRKSSCSPAGIPDTDSDPDDSLPVQLDNVGRHGFYCNQHGADIGDGTYGMKGLIEVVP